MAPEASDKDSHLAWAVEEMQRRASQTTRTSIAAIAASTVVTIAASYSIIQTLNLKRTLTAAVQRAEAIAPEAESAAIRARQAADRAEAAASKAEAIFQKNMRR